MRLTTVTFAAVLFLYGVLFWYVMGKSPLGLQLLPTADIKSYRRLSLIYWLSPLFFIGVWGILASIETESLRNVPSPIDVLKSFVSLFFSGELVIQALISLRRVFVGFTLASIVGVTVGLLAGSFLLVNQVITPVNSFFRYIPPTAFISLLIVYFGVGETYKHAVIFLGVIFFIIQMVIDVVDDADMRYIEIGLTSGYSNLDLFGKVIVPFCWPRIFDVLRINLSAAWTFLVAAELVGAESGLGHLIAISQRFLRVGDLYAGILTFGLIGLATDKLLAETSKWLFRWYYVELRR